MRTSGFQNVPRILACAFLSVAMALCISGCKPTDFFTEVIIRDWAQEVDEDNPKSITVNNPDAEEESTTMAALDWSDDSERSVAVQKLVVYSKNPNTELTAHHSIFDLKPRFPGIEASDGVRLVYDSEADIDHEVTASENDTQTDNAESTGTGGQQTQQNQQEPEVAPSVPMQVSENASGSEELEPTSDGQGAPDESRMGEESAKSDEPRESAGSESGNGSQENGSDPSTEDEQAGTAEPTDNNQPGKSNSFDYELPGGVEGGNGPGESGNGPDGNTADPGNTGQGETSDPNETGGDTPSPSGGYNGTVPWYGEDGVYSVPPSSDRIAVLGTDALVLARAIGGPGAVCATSESAWFGLDENGNRRTLSYFGQVYASESLSTSVCWNGDGSNPTSCNVEALIAALGENGSIVYDQRLGNQQTLFTDDQRRQLFDARITLVPIDMSSVEGIVQAANLLGNVLAESEVCKSTGHDARQYADDYIAFIGNVVEACAASRTDGGGWLATDAYWKTLGTSGYSWNPVRQYRPADAYALISDDSEVGMGYAGDVEVSDIVLFKSGGVDAPLTFWQQVAGVWDGGYGNTMHDSTTSVIFWPLMEYGASSYLSLDALSGRPGGAFSRFLSSPTGYSSSQMNYVLNGNGGQLNYGLGSKNVPYLIVSASADQGLTANDVKKAVIESMRSVVDYGEGLSVYSVLAYGASYAPNLSGTDIYSTIGATSDRSSESPFLANAVSLEDTVRENPIGLLGDWTDGSMESVLEAIWLTDLYSRSPVGSDFSPVNDMSKFSVTINGVTCTNTRDVVLEFYSYFYDVDVATIDYEKIVTDEG